MARWAVIKYWECGAATDVSQSQTAVTVCSSSPLNQTDGACKCNQLCNGMGLCLGQHIITKLITLFLPKVVQFFLPRTTNYRFMVGTIFGSRYK